MKAGKKQADPQAQDPRQLESVAHSENQASEEHLTGRERYVGARRRRETVIFSTTSLVLLVLLVLCSLVGFGIIPMPGWSEFNASRPAAGIGSVPCPPEGAKPVKPSSISARVINGTDREGLATDVANTLKKSGVKVTWVGNAGGDGYEGTVQITTGVQGVAAAYTVSRFFNDAEIILDSRSSNGLDITLGRGFNKVVSPEIVKNTLNNPLQPLPDCQPLTQE